MICHDVFKLNHNCCVPTNYNVFAYSTINLLTYIQCHVDTRVKGCYFELGIES